MDELLKLLFQAKEVKASARYKEGNSTCTLTLREQVPTDTSDESFLDAAKAGGVNMSVKVTKSDERGKNFSGKGLFGAAAVSATANVLGYVPVKPDPVPPAVKDRKNGKLPTASENGDGAK